MIGVLPVAPGRAGNRAAVFIALVRSLFFCCASGFHGRGS